MEAPRVAHLVASYLPHTQGWLHAQIGPEAARDGIVAALEIRERGPERFPVAHFRAVRREHPIRFALAGLGVARATTGRRRAALATPWLQRLDIDLAHAHFGHVGWLYLPTARRLGVPLVCSFYGYDMSELPLREPAWRERYGELFAGGDLFLCEGPSMAEGLIALGCPRERVAVQPLGVDLEKLPFRQRGDRPAGPLGLLSVGRFTAKKGLPDAVAAVRRASQEVDVTLSIIGGPGNGAADDDERKWLEESIADPALDGRVRLLGALPHESFVQVAAEHDVALQPSRLGPSGDSEGGAPVALIEMAATGMPAVATRHADLPEVVREGETGLLTDEGDVAGLAAHIVRLAREPETVARMSRAAGDHARARFDRARCLQTLRGHYADLLARASRARG